MRAAECTRLRPITYLCVLLFECVLGCQRECGRSSSSHRVASHLISSHLVLSRLISPHLIPGMAALQQPGLVTGLQVSRPPAPYLCLPFLPTHLTIALPFLFYTCSNC